MATPRWTAALLLAAWAGLAAPAARADGAAALAALLDRAAADTDQCGAAAAALTATRARLERLSLPTRGKLIVVNIASQTLTAYEDGEPAFEMRVVVGAPRTRTPEMSTEIEFIRFNPTWAVPASILREPQWRRRAADPAFLRAHGFTAYGADGRALSDAEVAAGATARLVQAPDEENALGVVKFGLRNSEAIYLHDTNERDAFEQDRRTLSHGCVRLEEPFALAAWVLGIDAAEAEAMQRGGDERYIRGFGRVPVVLGYFTAWPDSTGRVHFFRDVYGKDGRGPACALGR